MTNSIYFAEPYGIIFKQPIDRIPDSQYQTEQAIRKWFFDAAWYEIYDFLEFVASLDTNSLHFDQDALILFCNQTLKTEFSGFRFIDYKICPITNEHEISEIETSISQSENFTALKGVNTHLKSALNMLSDKKSPDYRNSIKESISAIESVAKVISKNSNDSLGAALDKIKGKINLHQALERGFKQLYGYTSDASGIRHALMDNSTCEFEDAKYMLVSSSAFINYLITKADKVGIKLEK